MTQWALVAKCQRPCQAGCRIPCRLAGRSKAPSAERPAGAPSVTIAPSLTREMNSGPPDRRLHGPRDTAQNLLLSSGALISRHPDGGKICSL